MPCQAERRERHDKDNAYRTSKANLTRSWSLDVRSISQGDSSLTEFATRLRGLPQQFKVGIDRPQVESISLASRPLRSPLVSKTSNANVKGLHAPTEKKEMTRRAEQGHIAEEGGESETQPTPTQQLDMLYAGCSFLFFYRFHVGVIFAKSCLSLPISTLPRANDIGRV